MKWDSFRIDQIGTISRGKSRHRPRDASHLYGGPYPFIQTGDVKASGLYITSYSQTYSDAGLAQSKLWPAGTLCITIAANIGDTSILSFDACFPDSVIGFVADPQKADTRFIKYLFDSKLKAQYKAFSQGVAQDNLSQEKLLSIDLEVPHISIQTRIAEILSAYDNLIENNRRQIKLLEESARLLYREWFVHLRFPGHEQVKVVDGVPEGWEKVPLSTIMDVNPDSLKKGYSGIIKYVDISSVSTGSIDTSTEYSFEDAPSRARRLVKHGDTIWSCVRPNLRAFSMVYQPEENLIVSTGFAVLRPKSVSYIEYLYCVTTTDDFVTYLSNVATGTSYPAVTQDDFSNAIILSPPDHLLSDFSRLTSTTFQTSASLKEMNKKLAAARDLLLPRLMSGELEV